MDENVDKIWTKLIKFLYLMFDLYYLLCYNLKKIDDGKSGVSHSF